MHIFVSHASEDRDVAARVALALRETHYVFFDEDSLAAGDAYHSEIRNQIDRADLIVFIVTARFLESGGYTLSEVDQARQRWPHPKGHVLTAVIDDTTDQRLPPYLAATTVLRPGGNIPADVANGVERLVRRLRESEQLVPSSHQVARLRRSRSVVLAVGGIVAVATMAMIALRNNERGHATPETPLASSSSATLQAPSPSSNASRSAASRTDVRGFISGDHATKAAVDDTRPATPIVKIPGGGTPKPSEPAQLIRWDTEPSMFRGRLGQPITLSCPPNGTVRTGQHTLYGTDLYAAGSICEAAAHSGLITVGSGGIVTLVIDGEYGPFIGSLRNGISTSDWGGKMEAFRFVATPSSPSSVPPVRPQLIRWDTAPSMFVGRIGQPIALRCPPNGTVHANSHALYGTDTYWGDSICEAAAHSERITVKDGGVINVVFIGEFGPFVGSVRHGISTSDWGGTLQAFRFVDIQ